MTRKEQEEFRAEKRRLKAEKKEKELKVLAKYAKENNISISCAKFRLNCLKCDSPITKRIKELMAQGKGFSSARRQASMEAKGTWSDNKWRIDEGYRTEDYKEFNILYNPNVPGMWEVTYKGKSMVFKPFKGRIIIQYYLGEVLRPNSGKINKYGYGSISLSALVWLKNKGDIPAGYVVDHIDNNSLNNNLDNLQLLTRGQNIKKNTRWSKGE